MTQKMNSNSLNTELVIEMILSQQDVHAQLLRLAAINLSLMGTVSRSRQKIRILEELKKDLLENE